MLTLPPLVKQQRRFAARIAAVADAVKDEKAIRAEIDGHLVTAGLQKSEMVTCAGYDVRHFERDGTLKHREMHCGKCGFRDQIKLEGFEEYVKAGEEYEAAFWRKWNAEHA